MQLIDGYISDLAIVVLTVFLTEEILDHCVLFVRDFIVINLKISMIKQSKFQELINSAINKLRTTLNTQELASFDAQISALPKKIKELNAEPYLFIFDLMLHRKELIESALTSLTAMVEQNYISHQLYERLAESVSPLIKDYSYSVIKLIQQIKQPHLAFIQLYFDIHSQIALPQEHLRKFKTHGYNWMVRVFRMTEREVPSFLMGIYSKFYPEEMPRLIKPEEEKKEVEKYMGFIIDDAISKVEENLGFTDQTKGKYGLCFLCRKTADYYCKDTKVPVCGVNCKKSHLQMLTRCSSLSFLYSQQYKNQLQQLLIDNISSGRSPALCIDFLVAVYLYSDYRPQVAVPHSRVMVIPVIFQRIWMFYLSYYGKLDQCMEHIFASCLTTQHQFLRQMASEYFLTLAQDQRILHIYNTFDRKSDFRLLTFVLHSIDEDRSSQLVQALIHTAYEQFTPNRGSIEDKERQLIRSFNHAGELTPDFLQNLFGEDYEREVVKLVLRNQTEINRQKWSYLICKNEEVCRRFMEKIVQKKHGAPIDQLIREIFYFVNIKVSDKIYRLFQILTQAYIPEQPFNQLNFFTYAYFVVMIVTEINNSSVADKPNLASVISRVQKFSPELAQNYPHLLRDMLVRVTGSPFRQNTRGVLSHYPVVKWQKWENIHPEEMVITNWEKLYECALGQSIGVAGLYRTCSMVAGDPAICQSFLRILIEQLVAPNRDPLLLQAISNTLESQPNAAGYLWKPILQQAFSQPIVPQADRLQISLIIHITKRLTSDNFYQFTKQFCSQVGIGQEPELFLQLIEINLGRIGMISQIILSNYERNKNYYQKLNAAKKIGKMLMYSSDQETALLLLQMIKAVPILPITQALVLEVFLEVDFDLLPHPQQFWSIVSQKCLQMKEETRVFILESLMKHAEYCQSYESYLIQKTLNCHKKELISEQIQRNLSKLEPYLSDISKDVLSLFILQDNLPTIVAHFEHFCTLNQSYHLLHQSIENDLQWVDKYQSQPLLTVICKKIEQDDKEMIAMDRLPCFLASILRVNPSDLTLSVIVGYVALLDKYHGSDLKSTFMSMINISIFSQQLSKVVNQNMKQIFQNLSKAACSFNYEQFFKWFQNLLQKLFYIADKFQQNIGLRVALKSFIQSKRTNLPSLLATSILLSKTITQLYNSLEEPSTEGFIRLLRSVQIVLDRQAAVQSQLKQNDKKTGEEKIILAQANRNALKFGQMLVEEALKYLRASGELRSDEKGSLRRVLLELLVQGFFDESSCSFRALTGTKLATEVNQIFSLLK